VVLDASWNSTVERHAAAEVAKRTSSSLIPFRCAAPGHLAADRIRHRGGPSDATAEVAERMRAEFAAWPGATVIDTAGELAQARDHALQVISVRRREDEEQG
jgi:predicted kinase